MTSRKQDLLEEWMGLLPPEQRDPYRQIADGLLAMGYTPKKQPVRGFSLAFTHAESGRVIAKAGFDGQRGSWAVKFFGCRDVPQRYADALRRDIESRRGQYCRPSRFPGQPNRCDTCPACTGGGLGYGFTADDGTQVVRCGAYPIPLPGVQPGQAGETLRLLREQHDYFVSLGPGGKKVE